MWIKTHVMEVLCHVQYRPYITVSNSCHIILNSGTCLTLGFEYEIVALGQSLPYKVAESIQ